MPAKVRVCRKAHRLAVAYLRARPRALRADRARCSGEQTVPRSDLTGSASCGLARTHTVASRASGQTRYPTCANPRRRVVSCEQEGPPAAGPGLVSAVRATLLPPSKAYSERPPQAQPWGSTRVEAQAWQSPALGGRPRSSRCRTPLRPGACRSSGGSQRARGEVPTSRLRQHLGTATERVRVRCGGRAAAEGLRPMAARRRPPPVPLPTVRVRLRCPTRARCPGSPEARPPSAVGGPHACPEGPQLGTTSALFGGPPVAPSWGLRDSLTGPDRRRSGTTSSAARSAPPTCPSPRRPPRQRRSGSRR
jgi:hypothetical protein